MGTVVVPSISSRIDSEQNIYPVMFPGLTSAGLTRGIRVDGRVSSIRRFFCLFVTFDLLLSSLLWLIILVIAGSLDWSAVYHQQILHYNIRTTLFDIVMCAVSRFVILLLFYFLLEISHWIVVAFTTAATCVLLIAKVFLFDWADSTTQVLQVVLILTSFILVWSEVWLMDIKVIPQERVARDYINAMTGDERSPLIRAFIQNQLNTEVTSEPNFYSPYDNSSDSDDNVGINRRQDRRLPKSSELNYLKKGRELVDEAWRMLNNNNWVFDKKTDEGDIISTQKIEAGPDKGHKIFKLTGSVNIPMNALKKILYDNLNEFSNWNPSIQEAKVLQIIDTHTDISYQVSKKVGLVSSREFVTLRRLEDKHNYKIIATGSIVWPRVSSVKSIVRGENGPGCWALRSSSPQKTEVMWLLNTKINGWVPKQALEAAMVSVMGSTMTNLRRHCNCTKE